MTPIWSSSEDAALLKGIQENGNEWNKIRVLLRQECPASPDRSAAAVRNRALRIHENSKQLRNPEFQGNLCGKCGKRKRGHHCQLASSADEALCSGKLTRVTNEETEKMLCGVDAFTEELARRGMGVSRQPEPNQRVDPSTDRSGSAYDSSSETVCPDVPSADPEWSVDGSTRWFGSGCLDMELPPDDASGPCVIRVTDLAFLGVEAV